MINPITIIIVGLSGIIAQVLLLRELLVNFQGNELTLGIILSNWILLEAAGAYGGGKIIAWARNKTGVLLIFQGLFISLLPFSVYLARIIKPCLGAGFGETLGIQNVFLGSFLVILPTAFCHGALFSSLCKISSERSQDKSLSIGNTYSLETAGTIIGGFLVTYLLIPFLDPLRGALVISLLNTLITLALIKASLKKSAQMITFGILLAGVIIAYVFAGKINLRAEKLQWGGREVLSSRDSVYGKITLVKNKSQQTLFYNGVAQLSVPDPDLVFVQDFVNFPMLFHPAPGKIMLIAAGPGGVLNELLKYRVKQIDYLEPDAKLIKTIQGLPSDIIVREFSDPRVKTTVQDARLFLRSQQKGYDLIMVGLSGPQDLSSNRYFSEEFFALAKEKLKNNGLLCFTLPGSLNHLSGELKELNSCIFSALKAVFPHVRVIPEYYNIYLASASLELEKISPELLSQRIEQRGIENTIFTKDYIDYRLQQEWLSWFIAQLKNTDPGKNHDFTPVALLKNMTLWNRQFSSNWISVFFAAMAKIRFPHLILLILFLPLAGFLTSRSTKSPLRPAILYGVATTGFFAMVANLAILFTYQISFGYLYYKIGLLISVFMAGTAWASWVISRKLKTIKNPLGLFLAGEVAIILFLLFLALTIIKLSSPGSALIFIILLFICGGLLGAQFPLASRIYLKYTPETAKAAGAVYSADLLGGWLAGLIASIILLPLFGIVKTLLLLALLKLGSLVLIMTARKLGISDK
jgi:spermidine synthase